MIIIVIKISTTGLNIKKKIHKPTGLVAENFTSPEIFLLALILVTCNSFQVVTSVDIIASVDNMKRIQCIEVIRVYYHPGMQSQRRAPYFFKR